MKKFMRSNGFTVQPFPVAINKKRNYFLSAIFENNEDFIEKKSDADEIILFFKPQTSDKIFQRIYWCGGKWTKKYLHQLQN